MIYPAIILFSIVGIISLMILILIYINQISRFHIDREQLNKELISIIKGSITPTTLTSSKPISIRRGSNSTKYVKISKDLIEYAYALHPVRIAIMKHLHINPKILSSELRKELHLDWNNYTPHLNVLEKKGIIELETKFVEEKPMNEIDLTQAGRFVYQDISDKLLVLIS